MFLLISILTYLNCGQEQVESLRGIRSRIAETFQSERKSFHMLSMATLVKTMLYRSLREFEKEFSEYFKLELGAGHENEDHEATVKKPSHSFSNFCKTIKRAFMSKRYGNDEKGQRKTEKVNLDASFSNVYKNIVLLRNKFAHNANITNSETVRGLENISELLKEFELRRQSTTLALKTLTLMSGSDGRIHCELNKGSEKDKRYLHTCLLRPSVAAFVGRQQEIISIKKRFCVPDMGLSRVAVIYGAAGIGKTYLANKLTRDISCI